MESTRRSLVKALSWRLIATLITGLLAYLLTGEMAFAAKIGLADTGLKFFCYLGHERLWNRISFGRATQEPEYTI